MTRILLVEDDTIVQHVHKSMLQKLGYQVDLVESGAEALNHINSTHHYRIILVDIGLPDMSGYELIKKIRENGQLEESFPIIALTGYIGEQEKRACLAAGATEVLHKPVLIKKMQETLNHYSA